LLNYERNYPYQTLNLKCNSKTFHLHSAKKGTTVGTEAEANETGVKWQDRYDRYMVLSEATWLA
jgi:hypothetical protein